LLPTHLTLSFSHYKSFRVTAYLPFCSTLFAAGFALREYGAFHYDNVNIYLASTLLIYRSPYVASPENTHPTSPH
jgi:hypothetical protein